MATKEQVFEWIRYTCVTDTDAEQVAEIVATKLAEENVSSHNKQSTPCDHDIVERYVCIKCGGILTAKFD